MWREYLKIQARYKFFRRYVMHVGGENYNLSAQKVGGL